MDGAALRIRVPADLLEGIDATQLNVLRAVAELVDCPGEPLGDLALLGDLKLFTASLQLPVREVDANQDRRPADALQQGGADIVHSLRPLGGG
jgi:hypothetical protein